MGNLLEAAGYKVESPGGGDPDVIDPMIDVAKEVIGHGNETFGDALDVVDIINGVSEMADGDANGMRGVAGGLFGLLSPVGGAAYLLGDVGAEMFFNQKGAKKKAEKQGIDGRFHATSGNGRFDDIIEFFTGGDYSLVGAAEQAQRNHGKRR
jgi:hypothetical protein